MTLTKNQEIALNKMKEDINTARSNSYESWMWVTYQGWRKDYVAKLIKEETDRETWERNKKGIVSTLENTKTLQKLEKDGFIKIIEVGGRMPDLVEVLNY